MIHILHISDLHFVKNASAYNTEEVLLREASEKVRGVPQGKKLLIVTGDFHNFWDKDYQKPKEFLEKLVTGMGLDMKQDVFVIPGNHDVGNDATLEPLLQPKDSDWKSHQKSCLNMLKNNDKDYVEERLLKFLPYCVFLQRLGIYDIASDEKYPARTHVRCWRSKLNILHLNTALIADGTNKNDQMTDADIAANPKTWNPYYDAAIPSIAIGHCNFYDLKKDQRADLAGTFALRNVSAYLCGDRHQTERDPEYRTIPIQPEVKQDIRIPNLVAAKSIADGDDSYSEVGFCWHYWDEVSDEVSVEFRKWTRDTRGKTEPDGEGRKYDMRHERPVTPGPKDIPDTDSNTPDSPESEDNDAALRNYLAEVLRLKRNSHPSFKLMTVNEVDSRLYPNIKEYRPIDPRGKVSEDGNGMNLDSCPIWKIIRNSWSASEHRSVVILGDGGIGKTVALFRIVESPDGPIPVPALYIPMYELVDKDGQLLELDEYLTKRYRKYSSSIDSLATRSWNDQPQLLILLDGFNEIPFSLRRGALDIINEWHDTHPGAQLIAVSRLMDGLNLVQELAGNPLSIELSPLQENTVRKYLKEVKRQIPANGSPIWEDLRYPLFLNLYIKSRNLTKNLPAGYPLSIMNADKGGSLIWNFLQRELLRHRSDKSEKAENWVLRCAVSNEYILPFLAYRMLSEHRMDISYKQAVIWIKEALDQFDDNKLPHHLAMIWTKYEQNHGQVPGKDIFSFEIWRNTVLHDSGILVPLINQNDDTDSISGNYVFMHQHFRDCLAGLYLANQAEASGDSELPLSWRQSQNYLALDYAAELMDGSTADRLWEINRRKMQYNSPGYVKDHIGTLTLLELQKRRRPLPKGLDFSGIDLRGLSLTRYMDGREEALPLFRESCSTMDTKLDRSTFQNEGHNSIVTACLILPNGRVVSSSDDHSLRVWDSSTGQCVQVLEGHRKPVNCIALLHDGHIVSGSDDCSLRIWDPSTGQCVQVLEGHHGNVICIAVLPDGRVVSSSLDNSLRVWDPSTGQCVQVLKGHDKWVDCVAVLLDGRIVSGSGDHSLRVWDSSTGQCLQVLKGHRDSVRCIAVLPDGRVVSGSNDYSLRVWDPSTGQCLQVLEGHRDSVFCISVLPDGHVISGSDDHSLRVWDPSTGQCLQVLEEHRSWIMCITVLPDGRVISGSGDHSLRVWNPSTGQCLQVLEGHRSSVRCITFLLDGCVVSGSDDHSLRVWDPSTGQCVQVLEGHTLNITCMAVLPDGRVVCNSNDCFLRVWDPSTGQCLQVLEGHHDSVGCITVLSGGCFVSGSDDHTLRVWDSSMGQCLQILEGHCGWVRCMAVLPDGRVVSGSWDYSLRVWDPSTGQCLQSLEGHSSPVSCVAILPDGRIVSGSYDHSLRVWDPSTGQCLQSLEGHSSPVSCVAVLPDGRVVSGANDHSLLVWDPSTGQCLQILKRNDLWANCIAVLPDGHVVCDSSDGSLLVWDLSAGQCLEVLEGDFDHVNCIAVLPDGRVVCDSMNGSLRMWDPSTGQYLQTLERHNDYVSYIAVLPDGHVISGSWDGSLRVWDLSTEECQKSIGITTVNVSHMNLSSALLTKDLAKLLWQNGAKISDEDYERYVRPSNKE